jgi:hypothetical protein
MYPNSNNNTYPATNCSNQLWGSGNVLPSLEEPSHAVPRVPTQSRKISSQKWMTWLSRMSLMRCRVRSQGRLWKKLVYLMKWTMKCLHSVATSARVLHGIAPLISLTLYPRTDQTSWIRLQGWTSRIWDWYKSLLNSVSTLPTQQHSQLQLPPRVAAVEVYLRICTKAVRRRQWRPC